MKIRLVSLALVASMIVFSPSCATTYDAYGYPVQTVDAGAAAAGIVAAGLLGYALANRYDNHPYHYRARPYRGYGGGYHHRPYCR